MIRRIKTKQYNEGMPEMMDDSFEFVFENDAVRKFIDDRGMLWFSASDITKLLNFHDNFELLDNIGYMDSVLTLIDGSDQIIINEPGLYKAIMNATTPEAREFIRKTMFITRCIREIGAYFSPKLCEKLEEDPSYIKTFMDESNKHSEMIREYYADAAKWIKEYEGKRME